MLNLLQNEKLFNSQIYELLFFFLSLSLLSQFIHCENSFRCTFSLHTKIFFLSFSLALDFSNLLHRLHFISFYIFCCFQLFLLENFHFLFDFLLFFLIFFSLSAARSFHWQKYKSFLPLNSWTFCLHMQLFFFLLWYFGLLNFFSYSFFFVLFSDLHTFFEHRLFSIFFLISERINYFCFKFITKKISK